VGVGIDKAGRENPSVSVYYVPAYVLGELPDRANDAGSESYIRCLCFGSATVEHANVPDKRVTRRHMAW
jgi:hypothetical protein